MVRSIRLSEVFPVLVEKARADDLLEQAILPAIARMDADTD